MPNRNGLIRPEESVTARDAAGEQNKIKGRAIRYHHRAARSAVGADKLGLLAEVPRRPLIISHPSTRTAYQAAYQSECQPRGRQELGRGARLDSPFTIQRSRLLFISAGTDNSSLAFSPIEKSQWRK